MPVFLDVPVLIQCRRGQGWHVSWEEISPAYSLIVSREGPLPEVPTRELRETMTSCVTGPPTQSPPTLNPLPAPTLKPVPLSIPLSVNKKVRNECSRFLLCQVSRGPVERRGFRFSSAASNSVFAGASEMATRPSLSEGVLSFVQAEPGVGWAACRPVPLSSLVLSSLVLVILILLSVRQGCAGPDLPVAIQPLLHHLGDQGVVPPPGALLQCHQHPAVRHAAVQPLPQQLLLLLLWQEGDGDIIIRVEVGARASIVVAVVLHGHQCGEMAPGVTKSDGAFPAEALFPQ
ncbi:hypothetical protein JZ751_007897 [Albula glossodonta]|uniref:Uncharacterized protein n=1 Tax=Albula glossodonta TaxID=121402 RepID=A0A8T2P170_9TELE|nr:hypothetical protein JZ751_007897 [Albula glossodonta]